MKIKYTNTLEDAVAFTRYHYAQSTTLKKQKKKATVYTPLILIVVMLVLFLTIRDVRVVLWGSVFIGTYSLLIRRAYSTGLYKTIEKLYKEQDMKGFVCEHLLELNEEGIIETTDVNKRLDNWSGVQSIDSDHRYAFIYLGAVQAHIVPKERIIEGDFDQFLVSAKTYWEKFKSVLTPDSA